MRLLAYDEGRQRLLTADTEAPAWGWELDLAEMPLARDLQRIGPDLALVGFDRGYFEVALSTGRVTKQLARWTKVSSVRRLPDGLTLVTGLDLAGQPGVTVLTLDASDRVVATARRDGDYVRLMRPTAAGTWLLGTNDHFLETRSDLTEIRRLAAPGFVHAWMAHRFADGTTLVSAGYGAFMARFSAEGELVSTFGRVGEVPAEAAPKFYASFQVVADGRIVVANWQGHGPDNGHKGRQLLEFSANGQYLAGWSDPERISSLQGILVLE